LAAIVFVFELTRDYQVVVPLMLATAVADIVFGSLSRHTIMTGKLSRRGLRIGRHYGVDPFTTVRVGQIMSAPAVTLPAATTVAGARQAFLAGGHGAYPLVDHDGIMVGIVGRVDLLGDGLAPDGPVLDHASPDVVSVTPDDEALVALQAMVDEGVDHLPVLDGGRLAGICTRTDLLKVRHALGDHERVQVGLTWRRSAKLDP
ncbi:MAG: hypothetical protein QOE93_1916, partial [Actinomycetota bacterium]|nr:hypothetical protein [Actinomycetota bacterium]